VARLALQAAGADPRRISARHVEALLALAASSGDRSILPRLQAERRSSGELRLTSRR
jgi:hypothetical protein